MEPAYSIQELLTSHIRIGSGVLALLWALTSFILWQRAVSESSRRIAHLQIFSTLLLVALTLLSTVPVPEPLLGAPRFAEPKSKPTLTMLATPIARQETISYHAVDFLTNRQTERRGYGVYTYVLFGRRINKTGDGSGLEPLPRYQALLDALAKSTEQVKTTPVVGLSDLILTLAE